jgi:hypothetical protein
MTARAQSVGEVVARYRGISARAGVSPLVLVRAGGLSAMAPATEVARAEALLVGADAFGLVPAPTLARLFAGPGYVTGAAHVRTALARIGAHLISA